MAFNFFGCPEMSTLFQEIRQLCAKHGYRAVHDGLATVMQEDYLVLKEFFSCKELAPIPSKAKANAKEVVISETIDTVTFPDVFPSAVQKKKVTKAKKQEEKVVAEYAPAAEMFSEDLIDGLVDSSKLGQIKSGTEIVVSKLGASEEPEVKPTFVTAAEERQWQKEEEAKTRAKLDATGISPESLLTRENLEQWIQKEKKGYAYVARRHIGLPEAAVVAACKELGIVSDAAKRSQAIVAARANAMRGRGRGR
jgi:hypothetical protein